METGRAAPRAGWGWEGICLCLQGVPAWFAAVCPLGLRVVPPRFAGCPCLVCSAHAVGAQPVLPSPPPCPLVSPCHCSGATEGRGDFSPSVSEQRVAMLCAPHRSLVLSRLGAPGGTQDPAGRGTVPGREHPPSLGGRCRRALLQRGSCESPRVNSPVNTHVTTHA